MIEHACVMTEGHIAFRPTPTNTHSAFGPQSVGRQSLRGWAGQYGLRVGEREEIFDMMP